MRSTKSFVEHLMCRTWAIGFRSSAPYLPWRRPRGCRLVAGICVPTTNVALPANESPLPPACVHLETAARCLVGVAARHRSVTILERRARHDRMFVALRPAL